MRDEVGSLTHGRARHQNHHIGKCKCLPQKKQRLEMERVWCGGENQGADKYEQERYTPFPGTEAGVLRSH